jgi:hypothetical protein
MQIFLTVAVLPVPGAPKKMALLSFLVAESGFPLQGGFSLITLLYQALISSDQINSSFSVNILQFWLAFCPIS